METPRAEPSKHNVDEDNSESSWREGLKIAAILLGVWMWDKMVSPYLKATSSYEEAPEMSRTLEIPLSRGEKMVPSAKG